MAENDTQKDGRALRELEGKNIAHYQTLLSAWIETRMEHDRTLINLSSGAIGLEVTILLTAGIESTNEIWLYIISLVFFSATIGILIAIYERNSEILESEIRGMQEPPSLKEYDITAKVTFALGVLSFVLVGILKATGIT